VEIGGGFTLEDIKRQANEGSGGLIALTRTLERDIKPEEGFLISELQLALIG